jgi:VWFA-related protein
MPVSNVCRLLLAAVFLSSVYGQQNPSASADAKQTLHTSSRLVVLDVVVTDKAGAPVENLTADDFAVLEDGATQAINSFEPPSAHLFRLPKSEESSSGIRLIKNGENAALTIFVLDEFNSSFEESSYARRKLHQFLESHTYLQQPASLMRLTQFGLSVVADYTCDGNALLHALEQLPVQSAEMLLKGRTARQLDRAKTTLAAFNQIALASQDHKGRKNVVWIGSGLANLHITGHPPLLDTIRETATHLELAHVSAYVVNARGISGYRDDVVQPGELPGVDAALRAGGISDSGYQGGAGGGSDFTPFQDSASGDVVFAGIAAQTGGEVFANRNDLDVLMDKAITDGNAYYALSYYPANKNWNGNFRRIQVRLRPTGLAARTRKGYFAAEDSSPTEESIEAALALAVRSQVEYIGIPFDATARIDSTPTRSLQFKLRLDGHALSWTPLPNGDLQSEITVVIADVLRNDKVAQSKILQKQLAVHKPAQGTTEAISNGPILLTAEAAVPAPASSRIRLVIRDAASGRMGTWDMPTETIEGLESKK